MKYGESDKLRDNLKRLSEVLLFGKNPFEKADHLKIGVVTEKSGPKQ